MIPTHCSSPASNKHHARTLFVDHASHHLHFTPHQSTGSKEAIQAKHSFELHTSHHNRFIKGIFSSKEFRASCLQQKQRIRFCGVNAHHQNGIAEHHIRSPSLNELIPC
jgi:hypothetical protein